MNNIKSVSFDLEWTVVDVEVVHHSSHINAAKDFWIDLSLEDCINLIPHFIWWPDEEVAKELAWIFRLKYWKNIDYMKIYERKKYYYDVWILDVEIKPRDWFLPFIQQLKSRGLKYTIGSLTSRAQAIVLLQKSGLMDVFGMENVVLREDVKCLKPAPDVRIETAKRAWVSPEEQMVFEDWPKWIQWANSLWIYCVWMPCYTYPKVLEDLREVWAKEIFLSWEEVKLEKFEI